MLSIAAAAAVQAAVLADQPEAIVVTGERVTRSVRETASSVDVVTRQQIEAASADRIEQILDLIPNVQVSSAERAPRSAGRTRRERPATFRHSSAARDPGRH